MIVALHVALWAGASLWLADRVHAASTVAAALVGLWTATTLAVPPIGKALAERLNPVPDGGTMLLAARETVNDAWDLPKAATMTPFLERHPEWAADARVERPFEWKWYYAFQQMGDETAAQISGEFRGAIAERDRLAGRLAWLSPSVAVQRGLEALAETDVEATLRHDARIRAYHAELRRAWYPLLFEEPSFDRARLEALPEFDPAAG